MGLPAVGRDVELKRQKESDRRFCNYYKLE